MEIKVNESNFKKEVLESDIPVLVDFWADWCGPCSMVAPILKDISNEYTNIKICKINVDEEPALCDAFNIESIPTMLIFKNGKLTNKSIGYISKEQILKLF